MTETRAVTDSDEPGARWSSPEMRSRLAKRHAAERRFRRACLAAIALAVASLGVLLVSIAWRGMPAFRTTDLRLDVGFDPVALGIPADASPESRAAALASADYRALLRNSLDATFPDVQDRRERRELMALLSRGAEDRLRSLVEADPSLVGSFLT